ncbi:MAG: hypothetical protein H6506_02370 [Calditrichaeota bacterium]|nr:hypothetical protein [Calditrichota bacterium]MCB9391479.1 hypothetical protein [Calditrichota bacterium]
MDRDEQLISELINALKSGVERYRASDGVTYTNADLKTALQELIPAEIIVKRVCDSGRAIVVAAPHVSFDNWTEYFANRLAFDLECGEVLARNFRDDDGGRIPVSIGRHIHVNRPTESRSRSGAEFTTERASQIFESYVHALEQAVSQRPLELLIELHGHRNHAKLDVATSGISRDCAQELKNEYQQLVQDSNTPELRIEPLDTLRFRARRAKSTGSLQTSVCLKALHIEIPRRCREHAQARETFRPILTEWIRRSLTHLKT